MSWTALGEDPVPGDVDAVLRLASTLGGVGEQAELVTGRLRALDAGTGPQIWRGAAADSFRDLLAKVGPNLVTLATSHHEAQDALRTYAAALEDAQAQAGRAEAAAETAQADRSAADARRSQGAADAAAADSVARTARQRILEAQAEQAATPDPVYHASLQQYLQQVAVQDAQARSLAADARRRESAAAADRASADARVAAAKKLADQAAQVRDAAARTATRRLDDARAKDTPHESFLSRAWNGLDHKLRDLTASPAFASWMNIISDVGEVVGDIGAVLALFSFIPGVGAVAAAFLLTGAAFKGVAFLGTFLARLYGNASTDQVLGRGLDFGLSAFAGLKALKAAREAAKAGELANGMMKTSDVAKLGGQIKRAVNYDDARKATGVLRGFAADDKLGGKVLQYLDKAHVDPKTAYRLKTLYNAGSLIRDTEQAGEGLAEGGQQIVKDVRRFRDPEDQHLGSEEAPDAAKEMAGEGVDKLFGEDEGLTATVTEKLAGYDAEKLTEEVVR